MSAVSEAERLAALRNRADTLMDELAPRVPKLLACHWIAGPDWVPGEWCYDCARAKVRSLRRHHPKRSERGDFILDGGWRTDHDHLPDCEGCGARLSGSLTAYGAANEAEYYTTYGVTPASRWDAHALYEALNSASWATEPGDVENAEDLCAAAEAYLWSAT